MTTTGLIVQHGGDLYTRSVAVLDPTGTYRYLLRHQWNWDRPVLVWVMLNPSTADAFHPDPTITRVLDFTDLWGYGGICVLNLFALRSTDPDQLATDDDPVGPANDTFLAGHITAARTVIAAWGAHRFAEPRAAAVTTHLATRGIRLHCLGTNRGGSPKHPLYLPRSTKPRRYPAAHPTLINNP